MPDSQVPQTPQAPQAQAPVAPAAPANSAAFDSKAWLNDFATQAKLTPEQRAAIEPVLTSDAASSYLRDQVLMRSDYSRRQDELAKKQQQANAQIEAQKAEVMRYFNDLQEWRKAQEDRYGAASQEANSARARVAALEAKAREAAATYGISADELIPPVEAPAAQPPAQQQAQAPADPNAPRYLTADQGRALAEILPYVGAVLDDLAFEHQQLTGERLSAKQKREMLNEAITSGKINSADDVDQIARSIWETKYQIADKRAAITKADHEKAVQEAYERGAREARSGESLPVPSWNANPQRPNALSVLKKTSSNGSKDYLSGAARDFEKRMARLQNQGAA